MLDKKYYRHSGYPGGLKVRNLEEMLEKKPIEVIRKAVERMLPKNKLGNQMINRLKIYTGNEYNHVAQKTRKNRIIGGNFRGRKNSIFRNR